MLKLLEKLIWVKEALGQGPGGPVINPGGVGKLPNPLGTTSIETLLDRIVAYLYTISIPIVAIMIIIGAFQMMFAGGSPEKVTTGRKTILYSVIGFAIIVASTGIIEVIKTLLGAS